MSRTIRKMQKKNLEPKQISKPQLSPQSDQPADDRTKLLRKLLDVELNRQNALKNLKILDVEILDTLKTLLECDVTATAAQKKLEQKLQQTRHELQTAIDERDDAHSKLRQAQDDKSRLEEKIGQLNAELSATRKERDTTRLQFDKANEIITLKIELARVEDEISNLEQKIKRYPKRDRYELSLIEAQDEREQILSRLKQLEEDVANFLRDSSFELPNEESKWKLWQQINEREPTDEVVIRNAAEEKILWKIWSKNEIQDVPSDFVRDETVPLEDFVITFAEENFSVRMVFVKDVGAIIFKDTSDKRVYFFASKEDEPVIAFQSQFETNPPVEPYRILRAWYGVEFALLNPLVKERFTEEHLNGTNTGSDRKNVVAYVKYLSVTVSKLLDEEPAKFIRRTEKWGVAGHWRKLSTGKMIWVRPYEKGRKRGQKLNQDLRERVLVTES